MNKHERRVAFERATATLRTIGAMFDMPRTPIIVSLADGKDHLIIDGEITGCGQIVPPLSPWLDSTTRACSTCFPDGKVASVEEASESELIDEQQEVAGKRTKAKSGAKA